ncbi:unnamed protein product, partial [Mesorhabditis belari]|uniref:PH domain-containing protein n=1 Tax=Mesorhabditis belari TaxID=2138241 RepID=A0AAF3ESF4_9BILA
MAHLIEDRGHFAPDGSWPISVLVTDMNIQRNLYVNGEDHIGGSMLRIVNEVDIGRDWSDHALWWPEKRRWLRHTRSTLDQNGITAETQLEFTPRHKEVKVQLPDKQLIDARLDFSVNVFQCTQQLCRDLGIRYSEELSLKRYIPPEILRKGTAYESENGPTPIRPGEESIGPMTLRKATPIFASQSNLDRRKRHQSPALSTQGHVFNAYEMGTLPRHGNTLPRGISPGPGAYNDTMRRNMMPSISFCEGLENENFDMALVHSPRIAPTKDTPVFRPQTLVEKAALNRGWLDSSRSLMEQGVFEGDIVILQYRFMSFFDLNPRYDPVRINQLYEQAKWSILLEELDHTEEEATLFAALQLQATLQRDSPEPEEPGKDDVDIMLDELEQSLDAAAFSRRSDLTQVPELADYLKYMKPKKLAAFKGFKRAFFTFRDLYLSYYNSSAEIGGNPLGNFSLKGCEVAPDVSVSQGKYHIKLLVPTAEGMTDLVLKCETEHQYARWMAACRLASRGKSMADASYQQEVDSIKGLINMQQGTLPRNENGSGKRQAAAVRLPDDFNVEEYVSQRYAKRRSKQQFQQRISDAHSNVKQLTATEAKLQYVRAWQALPEHGMHYFVVRFRNGNRKSDLIGIASNRIVKFNIDNGESVKTWRYTNMKKWHVNWEIRHLKVQFNEEDIEFKPLSADCKVVHEFIGGYIFVSMRNKEQSQQLNEEMFHQLTGGWG